MRIEDKDERDFYEKEAIRSNWNVSTLKRQFHSSLYAPYHLDGDISNAYLAVNLRSIKAIKPAD